MHNNFKTIIAIDPGANGSITHVKIKDGKMTSLICVKMPTEFSDMNRYLGEITEGLGRSICFIEKVGMNPSDMYGGKAFGIMKLLKNFEFLKAALTENNIGYIEVHPATWQSVLKLRLPKGSPKETKTERKNRYKEAAQGYFPDMKVLLYNSDALLILAFGWTKLKTDQQYIMQNIPKIDSDLLF